MPSGVPNRKNRKPVRRYVCPVCNTLGLRASVKGGEHRIEALVKRLAWLEEKIERDINNDYLKGEMAATAWAIDVLESIVKTARIENPKVTKL